MSCSHPLLISRMLEIICYANVPEPLCQYFCGINSGREAAGPGGKVTWLWTGLTRALILAVLQKAKVKVSAGLAPPGGSEGEPVPHLSPTSGGDWPHWVLLACRCITHLCPHLHVGFSLWAWVSKFPSYHKETSESSDLGPP